MAHSEHISCEIDVKWTHQERLKVAWPFFLGIGKTKTRAKMFGTLVIIEKSLKSQLFSADTSIL